MLGDVTGADGGLGSGAEPGRTGDEGGPAAAPLAPDGCDTGDEEPTRGRGGVG